MLVPIVIALFLVPATLAAGAYALFTLVGTPPIPFSVGWVKRVFERRPTGLAIAPLKSGGSAPAKPGLTHPTRESPAIAVLIPAHDEEGSVSAAIRSVDPGVPVFVVADNCTDRTAAIARAAGASVLERTDGSNTGKGYALAFALPTVLETTPDVVMILDADATLAAGSIAAFSRVFAAGAVATQARVRSGNADAGPAGLAAAVGCEVDAAVAAGRDRFGLGVPLRGSGMAFDADLLRRHPWSAFGPTEDAEFDRTLSAAGIRVKYVPDAIAASDAPPDAATLLNQRRRWRAALTPLTLVRSKPLVLSHLAATVLAAVVTGSVALMAWAAWLCLVTAGIYLRALAVVGLTRGRGGMLPRTTGLVVRLAGVTAAGLVAPPAGWVRTPRPGDVCRPAV
jgi:cellulose synthase/poly-beta-1,6-N-acetylglucosamine synthase-like glycosyltransferase